MGPLRLHDIEVTLIFSFNSNNLDVILLGNSLRGPISHVGDGVYRRRGCKSWQRQVRGNVAFQPRCLLFTERKSEEETVLKAPRGTVVDRLSTATEVLVSSIASERSVDSPSNDVGYRYVPSTGLFHAPGMVSAK